MLDWMVHCRPLMASAEYGLVWLSFASVLWLSIRSPFGVIQGMVLGMLFATYYFAVKNAVAQQNWEVLNLPHSGAVSPWLTSLTASWLLACKVSFFVSSCCRGASSCRNYPTIMRRI
mmetsp:Transcript_40295/g.79593  ORF Transcript_40295/g.79593 Transcript_40295/m.79593 type:complete len:117 (+) Transcript_40295:330-680(+)